MLEVIHETDGMSLGAAIEHGESPVLGEDAGLAVGIVRQGVLVTDSMQPVLDAADVWIDFTAAHAVLHHLHHCRTAGRPMVIGTTGLDEGQRAEIKAAAEDIAIVFAPNMSIGVNLMFKLAQLIARHIGDASDIEIIEAHHNQKTDAPSGTAMRLGEIVAAALGRDLTTHAVYGREGQTSPRNPQSIGFATLRAGDIIGEHTALFASAGERLELKHIATSRRAFATGAVRAAEWLARQDRGLYDMQDVLGLR